MLRSLGRATHWPRGASRFGVVFLGQGDPQNDLGGTTVHVLTVMCPKGSRNRGLVLDVVSRRLKRNPFRLL